MKTKTNNQNQNTPKTEPSANDKALAELVRTKVLDFVKGMKKVCNDNGLSFDISGWVEDPVDRGDTPEKTLTFNCGKGNPCPMLVHKIIDISTMLKNCYKQCSGDEVTRLCEMTENLVTYACKKAMNLNNKTKSESNKE